MKSNLKPKIIAASVVGLHHANLKQTCQDYNCHKVGKNLVAVVSDGAGSAKFGKTGAKVICETLCDILKNADFKNIKKHIFSAVNTAREKLIIHRRNSYKSEKGIDDFAATLVGVVYNNQQGMFFHIGDGAAIALKNNYNDFIVSRPENGDFSCETFFYTQHGWKDNLRFTHFEKASTILLMSDGVTNFSFSDDFKRLEHNFIAPIDVFLKSANNKSKAVKALANTLKDPKAQKINPDDKTLVWIKVD